MSDTENSPSGGQVVQSTKPEDQASLRDLVEAVKPMMPEVKEMVMSSARHTTFQVTLCAAGGAGVLALAFVAAFRDQWELAEKIAIPVLSFFAGLLAGRSKG